MLIPKHILPVIVFAQFCCTSLWFAGNSVVEDLIVSFQLTTDSLGHITSAVQFGFITGTLIFALLSLADRFSPSKVFLACALLGSVCNLMITTGHHNLLSILVIRFITGFFLAGIYPVGMKIAADYFDKGLGKSLGYLVGALVLGTAFPHFIKYVGSSLEWKSVIMCTSILATIGGILIYLFVPDGPYRKAASKINFSAIHQVFENRSFRSAAFGYFGHMWELYALWTFIPIIISTYFINHNNIVDHSLLSFIVIGIGSLSCIAGGYLSRIYGPKKVARVAMLLSGICCLLSPLIFQFAPEPFILFLLIWGISVIMDSPMLSTLVAQNADPQIKGTALTIVNCIGFSITIISIQLINYLTSGHDIKYLLLILAIGPVFGLYHLIKTT